jgi:hypothetical protein
MNTVVRSWLYDTISPELQDVTRQNGHTARDTWLALENQFIGNRETHTLHIDTIFCNFVQGDLNMNDYCQKMKGFANVRNRTLTLIERKDDTRSWGNFLIYFSHNAMPT